MKQRWTESDVLDLLRSQTPEDQFVDYKREIDTSDKGRRELAKDVSAFANSGGGLIIWGVDEKNGIPTGIPGVDPVVGRNEVELWLRDTIAGRISPAAAFNTMAITGDMPSGKILFVAVIPPDPGPPHMVNERYYTRHGSQTKPAVEEEVRSMYVRAFSGPALHLKPTYERALGPIPSIQIWNVGGAAALDVEGLLVVGPNLIEGMIYDDARKTSAHSIIGIHVPMLLPNNYISGLLKDRGLADANKAIWFGKYRTTMGLEHEQSIFLDIWAWLSAIQAKDQWPPELMRMLPSEWERIGTRDRALAQAWASLQKG